jgi:pre-mRNA-processing factor 19
VGGTDGVAGIYSLSENKLQKSFKAGSAITDAAWYGTDVAVSTSSGAVKIFSENDISFSSHAGSANGLAMHPTGVILASVGVDKSFVFYDLEARKAVTQVYTDSGTILIPLLKKQLN